MRKLTRRELMRETIGFLAVQRIALPKLELYEYDPDEWGDVQKDRRKLRDRMRVLWAKLTKRD